MNDRTPDMIDLLGRVEARPLSLMLCILGELGREVDVASLDAAIDGYALKVRAGGKEHPLASIQSRREALAALVVGGALSVVENKAKEPIGWRMTQAAVDHHVGAIESGFVDIKDAPEWIRPFCDMTTHHRLLGAIRGRK